MGLLGTLIDVGVAVVGGLTSSDTSLTGFTGETSEQVEERKEKERLQAEAEREEAIRQQNEILSRMTPVEQKIYLLQLSRWSFDLYF